MKITWMLVLAALTAKAEILIINAGAPDDGFIGGTAYTIPQLSPNTLRYGFVFTRLVPCLSSYPYILTFKFIEPSYQTNGQRIFSVRINNQIVIDHIDLVVEAGFLMPFARSVVAVCSSDLPFKIRFQSDLLTRNAVVSSIEMTPLFGWSPESAMWPAKR